MSGHKSWEERYAASEQLFNTEPSPLLVKYQHLLRPGMKALAVGDGEGRNGVWMAEQRLEVTSVDLSATALMRAVLLAEERGVTIQPYCGDIFEWSWGPDQFDVIAVIFLHLPTAERLRLHQHIIRALRPNGLVFIEGYHIDQLKFESGGPQDETLLYTHGMLAKEFHALETLELRFSLTDVEEDGEFRGKGAVIHYVGRRPDPQTVS